MNRLLNVNAVAETLSLSRWTVRALIRDERLKPTRIGRRVLVDEIELLRFIASCKEPGPVPDGQELEASNVKS